MRKNWEIITEYCIGKKGNLVKFWSGADPQKQGFTSDGVVVGQTWDGPIVSMMKAGEPVAYQTTEEGALAWVDGITLSAKAENIDAAYELINYSFTPEVGGQTINEIGYNSAVIGASDFYSDETKATVKDFKAAQALSSKPIKFTLPGPLTIMDTTADCFYDDRPRLNRILADTINKEILALVETGCKHIQVDEPLFARQVNDALSFGFEGIDRCFHKVPKSVSRIVHMCCGYPEHLDDMHYKKADPQSYNDLSVMINEADFDQISIEDKHCCNNLELLEKLPNKSVIFGSIAIASSRTETLGEVVDRLKLALNHIDRERLIVAPDCGLGLLPPNLAEEKLRVMCQAAAIV